MKAYLDSSVVLRVVLRAENALAEWRLIDEHISSALLRVECLRTLERLRVEEKVPDEEIERRKTAANQIIESVRLLNITPWVLARAAEPFEVTLKSLDAIHLATAIAWRLQGNTDLIFATHDQKLARAASAVGFPVLGTPRATGTSAR
ncbi:MAG: type II toxin-antitoxin system VapC family toxin [Thermoanaerobaculia bacterium]